MEKTKTRVELEQYLGSLEELERQRAAGQLDRLHYMLKRGHQQSQLSERSGLALHAVQAALGHLRVLPILDRDTNRRLQALIDADHQAYRAWRGRFIRANLGPIAHKFLDLYEAVQVVEVPELPESTLHETKAAL